MEFLHSPPEEEEKVILALLVANKGDIFLLLYRWDTRTPLHRFKPMRCSGQRLAHEDGFPLMLIPCVSSLSFLLVTESGLIIYDQVTASQANTTRYSFKASDIAKSSGTAKTKQWTQWARPKRHLQHREQHDDIFLVREDGVIETCLIDFTDRKVKVTTSVTPGRLGICVDRAFCLLAGPAHTGGGDIIVAGGDMTDGGLFQARARQPMERIQTLPNGGPFQDLVLVNSSSKRTSRAAQTLGATEIFACCGQSEEHGSLAQIQYGLEAQIGWTVEHPDVASIERLWTLEVKSQESLLILSSHHSHTSMFALGLHEMDMEFADQQTYPGMDLDHVTLAAAMLGEGLLVQVTHSSVNLIPLVDRSTNSKFDIHQLQPLCADILVDLDLIAIAHRSSEVYGLSVCRVNQPPRTGNEGFGLEQVTQLQTRPISVQSAKLGGTAVILIGTEQGEIHAFGGPSRSRGQDASEGPSSRSSTEPRRCCCEFNLSPRSRDEPKGFASLWPSWRWASLCSSQHSKGDGRASPCCQSCRVLLPWPDHHHSCPRQLLGHEWDTNVSFRTLSICSEENQSPGSR